MEATVKKWVAGIALAMVLLAGMAGLSTHVNAVMPGYYSSVGTAQLAAAKPHFYCPPPPFECD